MTYPETTDTYWYALQVRSNCEQVVAECLDYVGIERYLPLYPTKPHRPRNRFADGMPLFPGYLFARLDLYKGPRMYELRGVVRILGTGSIPTPIEPEQISAVRALTNSGLTISSIPHIESGNSIVLKDGPLRGIRGTLLRIKNKDFLVVSLFLLRRSVVATIQKDWVTALPEDIHSLS